MRSLTIIAFLVLSTLHLLGQSLTAKVSRSTLAVGEHFQVSFIIEGDATGFQAPNFDGFRILSGPNKSSSMQWINGDFSSNVSYSYILMPEDVGEYTIGSARIKNNTADLSSEPIRINVRQGQQAQQPRQGSPQAAAPNQRQTQQTQNADDISSHVFTKLFVDKKEAYVGEQVLATYKLYFDIEISQAIPQMEPFNGFFSEDLDVDPNRSQVKERINGRDYLVATMKKVVLTPQKSGELKVPAMELSLIARMPEQRRRRSIFDSFFGNHRNVRTSTQSNVEQITVKPLPKEGQPADFTGAVGNFELTAEVDRKAVAANEAINLSVRLAGKGNIALTSKPIVKIPADFEAYDPKVKESISTDASGSKGSKVYEYVMIPRFAGDFEIEPVRFSFFNPSTKRYERLITPAIPIAVSKGALGTDPITGGYAVSKKEDVQIIGKDIRFIKTNDPKLQRSEDRFFGTPFFYMLSLLPFAGMLGAVFLFSFFKTQYSDIHALKRKRAGSIAKKHLSKARKQLHASDAEFFDEISTALFGYLADKLSIPTSELNREQIEAELRSKSVQAQTIGDLNKALDECEMVRFAPGVVRSKEEMLTASETIIEALDDVL